MSHSCVSTRFQSLIIIVFFRQLFRNFFIEKEILNQSSQKSSPNSDVLFADRDRIFKERS